MGGGDSNSAPPSDVAPGGGTYPVDAYGNAYNPSWGSSQFASSVGTGFKQLGAGIANVSTPNFMTTPTGAPYVQPPTGGQVTNLIPTDNGGDLLSIIKRLLAGGY